MKINCVIVTYNRLSLLKECIAGLQRQTTFINKIIIVDNNSSDGTDSYLNTLIEDQYIVVRLSANVGGAGGFSEGIKKALLAGCDWIWVMDDDTIPSDNALEELIHGANVAENVGYVCSRVVWVDGKLHEMNIPRFDVHNKDRLPLTNYSHLADVLLIKSASFVSLLINVEAIYKVGLPIKEFFIWGDDTEFTTRIYQNGYICLYAGRSVVLHKTPENYVSRIQSAPIETLWKFRYGIRNEVYLRRMRNNKIIFYFSVFNNYRRLIRRIQQRPQDERSKVLKIVRNAIWEGLFFRPIIEYFHNEKSNCK